MSNTALTATLAKQWPYTWINTTGAFGHALTGDTLTYADFIATLRKWNRAGYGQWRYYEGHCKCE